LPQPTERHAELLGEFLPYQACTAIWCRTLIWPRWQSSMGLHCAPRMVILRDFAPCVGLTRSRTKRFLSGVPACNAISPKNLHLAEGQAR
jgi:hypothetical protein